MISFTIKYVQSEKDKLKNEISKVLEQKNKAQKPFKYPELPKDEENLGYPL